MDQGEHQVAPFCPIGRVIRLRQRGTRVRWVFSWDGEKKSGQLFFKCCVH